MRKLWGYIRSFLLFIGGSVVIVMLIIGLATLVSNFSNKDEYRSLASDVATADQAVDQLGVTRVSGGRRGYIVSTSWRAKPVMHNQSDNYSCNPYPGTMFVEVGTLPSGEVLIAIQGDWDMTSVAFGAIEAYGCPNGAPIVVSDAKLAELMQFSDTRLREIDRERGVVEALVKAAPVELPWFTVDRLRNDFADDRVAVAPSGLNPVVCELALGQTVGYLGSDAGRDLYRVETAISNSPRDNICQPGALFFRGGSARSGG